MYYVDFTCCMKLHFIVRVPCYFEPQLQKSCQTEAVCIAVLLCWIELDHT